MKYDYGKHPEQYDAISTALESSGPLVHSAIANKVPNSIAGKSTIAKRLAEMVEAGKVQKIDQEGRKGALYSLTGNLDEVINRAKNAFATVDFEKVRADYPAPASGVSDLCHQMLSMADELRAQRAARVAEIAAIDEALAKVAG